MTWSPASTGMFFLFFFSGLHYKGISAFKGLRERFRTQTWVYSKTGIRAADFSEERISMTNVRVKESCFCLKCSLSLLVGES